MPDNVTESAPSAVNADFSLTIGNTTLNASVRLPAGRTTLTALLPIIQNLENAIVDRIGEEVKQAGKSISCRAGCGACCRQMVPVSLFEAEALTAWIRTLPEERQAELERRFHSALSRLRDAGMIEKILSNKWILGAEQTTQMAIDYFRAGVACPFLEDESCSIHPFRPLICREYLVTSPPELCKDPSMNEIEGIHPPVMLSNALFAFGQQIEQDPRGWIPLVFLLAWEKSGAKPGEHIAGTGKEVFGAFLEQVTKTSATGNKEAAG